MSDTPYTQGFRAGQENERERIIKLLEQEAKLIAYGEVDLNALIVLIKLGNK